MATTADFLVEIGTEELPPKALRRLEQSFATGIAAGISAASLGPVETKSFATPRRLAVLASNVALSQPVQKIEKRGPPVKVAFDQNGEPTRAALAFAEGFGVAVADLDRLETSKGEWLVYAGEQAGSQADLLLPKIVSDALADLPIPKRMRWGDSDAEFVRPVHWVIMMLDDKVVEAEVLGCRSDNKTRGHRFHAPDEIEITTAARYPALLSKKGKVLPDFVDRRDRVSELANEVANSLGGVAVLQPSVLDEVTALVEWPVIVTGTFDEQFLQLPPEVLVSTLQDHQRYFPVRANTGELMPNFIAISNLESLEPDQVKAGNERVVHPRLADAAFFWEQDRGKTLEARRSLLDSVVFERDLGSIGEKSTRVAVLADVLAKLLDKDPQHVVRAAQLAKTDLLTEMVGEFPELQGRMGYYYAIEDGEHQSVAAAIDEHYWPRHAGDRLPRSDSGRILGLADRLDTLAGIFAAGKRPSGNKDPFGLRRQALGLLRILIEDDIELDLHACLESAVNAQPVNVENSSALIDELYDFIVDRLKAYYLDGQSPSLDAGSITPEIFESVRARKPASPRDFHQRLIAVFQFMQLDAADSLAMANKRIANILRTAEDAPSDKSARGVDPDLFEHDEERRLHAAIESISASHAGRIAERDYENVLKGLAELKTPVDDFFDGVMVMADDAAQRKNRLTQLRRLRHFFLDVADLSCIPQS